MWLWPVFDYIKANKWAQIVLITLATICTIGLYLAWRDNGVRQRAKAQAEVDRMRERVAMIERKNQVIKEERTHAQEALAARDNSGGYPDYNSCQSPTKPLPKDGPDLVEQAVNEAKVEWCAGQYPGRFTAEQFDSAPQWVRDYITGNNEQFLTAGCTL